MLKFCNWIASLFGYRIMKVQTFECSRTAWTEPGGCRTITVEVGPGGARGGGNA